MEQEQAKLLPQHQEMIMQQRDGVVYYQRRALEENEKLSKLLSNFGLTSVDIQVVPTMVASPAPEPTAPDPSASQSNGGKVLPINGRKEKPKKKQ